MPHKLQGQGRQDQKGVGIAAQHRVATRPNEIACQHHRCHLTMAYHCTASALAVDACPGTLRFKFVTNENC
jgi:hypothetical protein